VRWDTGGSSGYNRRARLAISDYREKYNRLNYVKPVFEVEAESFYNPSTSYTRITKNDSLIWDLDASAYACVLAAAFNPDNGRLVNNSMKQLISVKAVNDWIDKYDHSGDKYVLALAKHKSVDFLPQCVKLGTVGSTLYNAVSGDEPWVFIVQVKDGIGQAKKETKGSGNKARATLVVPIDYTDNDGLTTAQEIRYGTSVTDSDTDDDGISDSAEIAVETNPRNPDSRDLSTDPQAKLRVYPLTLNWSNDENERYIYIDNDGGESMRYKIGVTYHSGSGWLKLGLA